jgi:ABC-type sugar transport system substrate-binding protein
MRRMSRLPFTRFAAAAALVLLGAGATPALAALGGPPDCVRFGLIASKLQADFLAGRSFAQARQDGLALLGPEHPYQAQVLQRIARAIYSAPDSRAFSPQARAAQVQGECLQARAQMQRQPQR